MVLWVFIGLTEMKNNKGFTLMELLTVVFIIAILTNLAIPEYQKAVERSRSAEAETILETLAKAEERYLMSNGVYTNELTDLDVTIPTSTKHFTMELTSEEGALPFTAKMVRTINGVTTSGNTRYELRISLDMNAVNTRSCRGTEYMCRVIGDDVTCADDPGSPWCYDGDL